MAEAVKRAPENAENGILAAAYLPAAMNSLYFPRPLSDDGNRLFFNSYDPLVLADTNGRRDVYQWEAPGSGDCDEEKAAYSSANGGCVTLISSGKSDEDSEFIDADPRGRDVFFTTGRSLVDYDPGQTDIYDARVLGGLPGPPQPEPSCEGEACQNPPAPPESPTPSSSLDQGEGDAVPPAPRPCAAAVHKAKRATRRTRRLHRSARRAQGRRRATLRRRATRATRRARRLNRSARRCRARARRGR